MSHSVLPMPLPAPPYTLRSLERYLDTLTLDGFDRNTPSLPYDFNRKARVLYRVASLYAELSGEEFGRIQGRTRDMLSFTEQQFRVMALVCYRATIDGTSYEYNLRRELGLPEDSGPREVQRSVGRPSGDAVASQKLLAEVQSLRAELDQLKQERPVSVERTAGEADAGSAPETVDAREVEQLRDQVGALRGALAEQEKRVAEQQATIRRLQERLDSVTADGSREGEAQQDVASRVDLADLRREVRDWNAQMRLELKEDQAGLERLKQLLEWSVDQEGGIRLGVITDVKVGVSTAIELLRPLYERADLDLDDLYGEVSAEIRGG